MLDEAVELEAYPHLAVSLIETHLIIHPPWLPSGGKLRKTEKENSNEEKQVKFLRFGWMFRR